MSSTIRGYVGLDLAGNEFPMNSGMSGRRCCYVRAVPISPDWIEHRRGDGELVGWMRPEAAGFVAMDLLRRPVTGVVDWLDGEEALESLGIGYLADPYDFLGDDGRWLRVRIVEVSADRVRLKGEDWGAIDAPFTEHSVAYPIEGKLRPHSRS
jgi:hypothetical protein